MARYHPADHQLHFCTITILEWLPVLIEGRYIDPIIESLQFCRARKGLFIFAYVIMPNHIHLIVGTHGDLNEIMRDFKRFTSRAIHEKLKEDGRATLLEWLRRSTELARQQKGELGFWRPGFHPQVVLG